jgi:hypothetical protein
VKWWSVRIVNFPPFGDGKVVNRLGAVTNATDES